jgi:triphosphatase
MLREAADKERRAAERACALAIDSASFTSLALGLSAWMESGRDHGEVLGGKSLERPLSEIATALLDRMAEKADKRGRSVHPEALAEELHPLRKSLKKVRYSVEFFSCLYDRKPVRRFVRPLKDLQKTLGRINDAATAVRLADRLVQERISLAAAMSTVARTQEHASRNSRKNLEKEWAEYRGQERFWR